MLPQESAPTMTSASAVSAALHPADALHGAIARIGSPACVGLDPVVEKIPAEIRARHTGAAEQVEEFCRAVIDAVADSVAIVKPQSACFERFGQAGAGLLRRTIQFAHARGLIVILDAKRGDIGLTAEHYAAAAFGNSDVHPAHAADWLTVNGYMGPDTVEPFLPRAEGAGARSGGVFVLVRTSNPGSDAVQAQRLVDGRSVAELVADHVASLGHAPGRIGACGLSCVGAVVGATKSAEAEALRGRMSDTPFLVPGYGAQGGTLDDLRPMLRSRQSAADSGIIVNASRSVIYPPIPEGSDFRSAVRDAARRFADELTALFR